MASGARVNVKGKAGYIVKWSCTRGAYLVQFDGGQLQYIPEMLVIASV
jgi:hypothetical protein